MYGAVDIGGTKTLIAVFSIEGKIVEQVKFPTPKNYDEFVRELAANVDKLSTREFQRVVVAIPGTPDRKHGIGLVFGNLPWKRVPIEEDVEKVFNCPAKIENDAKLAALSEALLLKKDYKKVLYITVSTGISGGVVVNGKLDTDLQDIEPGHMMLEHDGSFKIWEDFASGRAIVEKFGKRADEIDDAATWRTVSRNIAIGLNALIATLDPDVIVIGGGVGSSLHKFKKYLEEALGKFDTPMTPIPPIRKAARPEEAVIYGCYDHAKAHHGTLATKA
jgi:predicted NBD/HSP70 family sugar kinase